MRVMVKDGRVFDFVRETRYLSTRQHRWISLAVWQGSCTTCGEPFEVRTPLRNFDPERTHAFDRKRCDVHKIARTAGLKRGR